MELLVELNAGGKTILMVTHETEIAEYTKSRLHMRDGKVQGVE
jgi:putative ABC transport system ATP-binding protein